MQACGPLNLPRDPSRTDEIGSLLFCARIVVDKHHSKKNRKIIASRRQSNPSKRGRGLFVKSSPEVEAAEKHLVLHLRSRANEFQCNWPIRNPVRALFKFYYPKERFFTKQRKPSLTLPDLSNLYELPQDCLTKAKIIEDDWQIKSHDGSRILWHKGGEHILDIYLFEYSGPELLWEP